MLGDREKDSALRLLERLLSCLYVEPGPLSCYSCLLGYFWKRIVCAVSRIPFPEQVRELRHRMKGLWMSLSVSLYVPVICPCRQY